MNMHAPKESSSEISVEPQCFSPHAIMASVKEASSLIAPVWPLKDFVAVNPYLGLSKFAVEEADAMLRRAGAGSLFMPQRFYDEALAEGRIAESDLKAALSASITLSSTRTNIPAGAKSTTETAIDVATALDGKDWRRLVVEQISHFASAYWDEGQAPIGMPWRGKPLYQAWRLMASRDKAPEIAGLNGFRRHVLAMPEAAEDAIVLCARALDLNSEDCSAYLHRLLMTVPGWSSYARYKDWQCGLQGKDGEAMTGFLAILLAWDAFFLQRGGKRQAVGLALVREEAFRENPLACQEAYELGYQRELFQTLFAADGKAVAGQAARANIFFCIDVRSEVFRRSLEVLSPDIETNGFAGFFGIPLEYRRAGWMAADAQCPVLLAPGFTVTEEYPDDGEHRHDSACARHQNAGVKARLWKQFKLSTVSMFPFVETLGLTYAAKLVTDMMGWTRPVPDATAIGLEDGRARFKPVLHARQPDGTAEALTVEQRTKLAESVLRGMSLTSSFAPLVVLTGHGSASVNNPHAAGLDCGACGGHAGDINARVAATLLNDGAVRTALAARGIEIPGGTYFLAALHNTATDEVTLMDEEEVPAALASEISWLKDLLARAGERTRLERAARLGLPASPKVSDAIRQRSRDWSQTRPEWGLAGCAAFIAAPRHVSRGLDLRGRTFLHSYDWQKDRNFAVLELIMTAPVIVASWINLQYYGSVVNNRVHGAGNKVLHNVVGAFGVLEGNGGDLKTGLALQSVSDGVGLQHEPMRLNVLVQAPQEEISKVIRKHEMLRQLVENGWLHVFAIHVSGSSASRYLGAGKWSSFASTL